MNTTDTQNRYQLFWTEEDYLRLLDHPNYFLQKWACDRLKNQCPDIFKTARVGLLESKNYYLRVDAYRAIGEIGDGAYEEKLLKAYAQAKSDREKEHIAQALSQLESEQFWPTIEKGLSSRSLTRTRLPHSSSLYITLIGHYTKPAATELLWQLVSRHDAYDQFMRDLFEALMNNIQPDTIPRIVERVAALKPAQTSSYHKPLKAILVPLDLVQLAERVEDGMIYAEAEPFLGGVKWMEGWMAQKIPLSSSYTEILQKLPKALNLSQLSSLMTDTFSEFERVMEERNDAVEQWLDEWRDGQKPTEYRARTLLVYQTLQALKEQTWQEHHITDVQTLLLIMLGLYLVDEDDESRIAAITSTEMGTEAEYSILMDIFSSQREFVSPTVIDRLAHFGPDCVPDLIAILEKQDEEYWPLQRSLALITKIARIHPGSCDSAIDLILDLFDFDSGDLTRKAAQGALIAIGPAVPDRAAPRFVDCDHTYSIYIGSVLGDIPTPASQEVLSKYYQSKGSMEEIDGIALESLGQPESIELIEKLAIGPDQHTAFPKYTLALLNNIEGPDVENWGRLARGEEKRVEMLLNDPNLLNTLLRPSQGQRENNSSAAGSPRQKTAPRRLKKKRKQVTATTKVQKKQKKKRKRKK